MSISLPRRAHPEPSSSPLLRDAIKAHEAKLSATSDTREDVLRRKVVEIIGWSVDRVIYLDRPYREPVAIVAGVQFRWLPERPQQMEPGWLIVRTKSDGWDQVDSFEDLGAIARHTSLAIVDVR